MGISIRNTNLEFKDFDEILDEIAGKWGTLDNVSKRAIANAFAGVRQQESFLILLENYDKYKELLEVSETSEGTAEKKYQSYRESYAASRNEFTASLEQLANSSELSKLLRDLTDMGTKLIKILQEGFKYLPGIIQTFSLYRIATGQGLLTKGYDFLNKNKEGFSPFAGIKTIGKNFKASFGAIGQKLEERKLKKEQEKLNKDKKEAIKAEEKKVELSKQEALNKERTLNAGKEESQMKENTAQSGKQEQVEKDSVAQKAAIESQEKDATVNKGVQEEMNKEQVVQDSKAEVQNKKQVVQSSKEEAANEQGGSAGGAGAGGAKPSKMRAYLAMAEMGASIITTSLMQLSTAATTHKYNGETVESSEKAQKAGSAASAAISTIPLIGGVLGPIIGESIAQSIDEERDRANYATKQANENIGKLSSFSSSLDSIGEEEIGSAERHKLVKEFKEDIFDEDNEEMRKLLEKRLGGKNLSTLLSEIDSNTANSEEALRDLKRAQLEALKLQINSKYSSTMFENQEELNRVLADIEDYQGDIGAALGNAFGVGTVSTAGGALAGALTGAAIGSSATPVGTIVGAIVGAVAGLIAGIIGGSQAYDATIENSKSKYKSATWNSLNTTEKIDYAQEQIDFYRSEEYLEKLKNKAKKETAYYLNRMNSSKVIVDSNGNTVDAKEDPEKFIELKTEQYYKQFLNDTNQTIKELQRTIDILESQESIENQIFDEVNEITMQQAMNDAKVEVNGKNKYLNNMSIAELKAMGIDEILLSFATALEENGGLIGKNVWADMNHTQLSEIGYDYLFEQIKKQGDEEINAVLSGESYTLEEVFGLKNKYGETYQVKKLLKSFADALGVTVDELNNNADKLVSMYGKLTYAETIMSTEDLHTNIDNYANLLSSITSGAGQKSDWMETIISQFPNLLSSTNDTANLYGAAVTKMKELALTYRNAQYNDMMSSSDLFDDLKENFYSKLDADAKAALEEANVASLSGVMSWVQTQYNASTGELTEQAKNVRDIIIATVEEAGIEVATSQIKAYYDALIDFNTKVIDNEISNLESQKEALQEINSQREYENKLIEAKLKLEDAEKQKKRVYRAGVGWVYESDQSAIKEAQENLDSVSREKTVSQLEERITTLQAQKEELQNIYERQNFEELRKLNDQAKKDGDVMSTIDGSISTLAGSVDGISKQLSKMMEEEEEKNQGNKETAIAEAEEAWKELNSISPDSENYNTALENFHNKMNEAINNGATRSDFDNWKTYGYKYTDDQQAANRSSMQKGLSAWEVANMDIADQRTKTKSYFAVKHPEHAGYLVGNTNGDTVSDGSDMANTIFDAVKSESAFIWTNKDTKGRLTSDFAYQASESDKSLSEYLQRITESSAAEKPTQILVATPSGDTILYENGLMWKVVGGTKDKWVHTEDYAGAELFNKSLSEKAKIDTEYNREKMEKVLGYFGLKASGEYANGTLGVLGNSTNLINELGTEAIITPQGTIAALPSRTGIVPADITKNLWELGDVAPELIRVLGGVVHSDKIGKSIFDNFATDESFNISNLVMNIDADPQFDVDKFINAIKTRVSLTKNNSR